MIRIDTIIKFKNVSKSFGDKEVIKDISLSIEDNELVVLIGESGSGKTTMLKMINALVKPSRGKILINDKDISKENIIELRRDMGYVIQQTGLFPHMTIKENIEIIAKLEKYPQDKIDKRTDELIEMVGLDEDMLNRYPTQLSGGQQQRVGIARALTLDPEIILMDEPFSALDPVTKTQLQDELVDLQAKTQKTIVFVTHDMDEAVRIADKICVIEKGEIAQYDTPEAIMKNPANDYVREFVGTDRIWSAPELIRAQDIMLKNVITGHRNMSVFNALRRMYRYNVNSLVIVDRNDYVYGVLTSKVAAQVHDKSMLVSEFMVDEFPHALPTDSIVDILPSVNIDEVHSIPVIDESGILRGLLTQSNLMLTLSEPYVDDIAIDFDNKGVGIDE